MQDQTPQSTSSPSARDERSFAWALDQARRSPHARPQDVVVVLHPPDDPTSSTGPLAPPAVAGQRGRADAAQPLGGPQQRLVADPAPRAAGREDVADRQQARDAD